MEVLQGLCVFYALIVGGIIIAFVMVGFSYMVITELWKWAVDVVVEMGARIRDRSIHHQS